MLALANAKRVEYIPESLAFYYFDRPGNTATDLKPTIINDYLIVWQAIFDQLQGKKGMDILYYRLYDQIKYSLYKYALSTKDPFNDEYTTRIFKEISDLQVYSRNIKRVAQGTVKDKIVLAGFMNKWLYKFVAKQLVKKYN